MERVLEFLTRYLDFIYLNPSSRFVDSRTTGDRQVNAWIAIASGHVRWVIHADRDQVRLNVGTTIAGVSSSSYHTSLVRQFLEGGPERDDLLDDHSAAWVRANVEDIVSLFADEARATATCRGLDELQMKNVVARGWASEFGQA